MSAYKGEQAEDLESILADIRAGKYTVVVVAHSSRIDRRDPDQAMLWVLQVRMAGGRVESVREPEYGRSDLGGRIMTMLAQESNNSYSKAIGDNVRAAQSRSRANGSFVSGAVPFAYVVEGDRYEKRLVPDPAKAKVIEEVFDRIIRGLSLGAVAAWATQELGRNVWAGTITGWVKNPVYKGYLCQRMSNSKNNVWGKVLHRVPAIVDVSVWDAANASMAGRLKTPGIRKGGQMLTGVLLCQCGAKMYRIQSGGDKRWYYYCKKTPLGGGCGNLVLKDVTDRLAERLVSSMTFKVQREVIVPGVNYETEIHDVLMQLQGLNLRDKADRARQAELLDEMDRLESLETTPDRMELVETDETVGDEFAVTPEDQRNAWLREHGITFTAQNTKKFPKSPMWDMDSLKVGQRRSRAAEGNITVTVLYSPGRMMK